MWSAQILQQLPRDHDPGPPARGAAPLPGGHPEDHQLQHQEDGADREGAQGEAEERAELLVAPGG